MAFTLLADEVWNEIQPLLPPPKPRPQGGRPPVPDRDCLTGIIMVLRSGMPWNMLPAELGCGSGVTCWRRLRDWTEAGLWPEIHQRLLNRLGRLRKINLSRGVIDSASVRAVLGGRTPARTPRIEGKAAANAMGSRRPMESPWWSRAPPPMSQMVRWRSGCSMPFPRSQAPAGVLDSAPTSFRGIEPMAGRTTSPRPRLAA